MPAAPSATLLAGAATAALTVAALASPWTAGAPAAGPAPDTVAAAAPAGTATAQPAPVDAPAGAATAYDWPLAPAPRVLRGFDVLASPYAPGHRGVDLSASRGQEVLTAGAGTVTFAGAVAGRGVVVVAHADGLRTTYEPVVPAVGAGTPVRAGAVVGVLADSPAHCPAEGCLHWGARRGEQYVDPLALLRPPAPPVLLPLGRPG
ncbi:peptidase M23-like protein [Kineococcus xinjiangensis]|uniref:Peptidase M23-like protein n=1 Tax=Kineococcus xinjiangensis TaxID=512762 RepID=A0A2S6IW60_9ACTN|nr:peptidoglycan DD-metalloendopeptidase family protein [Kineococcus xinjiangensis]PPK98516.1 peptidase M23-like protein [Kineococcus xinjiangensis]